MILNFINNSKNEINQTLLEEAFARSLDTLEKDKKFEEICNNKALEVNLIFTNNKEIKKLNKKWRGIDKETDVLSFPYNEHQEGVFGEFFISFPFAKKQALELGHELDKELAILFVHGLLHLFGYIHETEREFYDMNSLEKKILKSLSL